MADEVLERYSRLHALANNAGVGVGPPDGARKLSADGIELRFAVNRASLRRCHRLPAFQARPGDGQLQAGRRPGDMDTAIVREAARGSPTSTVQEGLDAVWRLLTDPDLDGVSGHYFHGTQNAQPDPQADDPAAWAWPRQLSDSLLAR